ncbi:hypothetical protein GGX14DRAFT_554931 [Mycena pura]|uniref:RRM domain-containing protein n=1 Tax=Mycena pura TaxID=153505 RepID=A0AAD6YTS3_9AGAR|nr:hypothetical protein GGX14DRAFT_554931 [Mycena pura]
MSSAAATSDNLPEDTIIDDGEEDSKVWLSFTSPQFQLLNIPPQEILLMKQRVAEMEKEAVKLRELQAAAALESTAAAGEDSPMETEEDKSLADGRSIYIGNVDYGVTPEEIQVHFQACGTINRVTILCDKFTGHPKGFAYVEFAEPEHIDAAMTMDNSLLHGRLIKVTPKRTNIPGFNRGRGREPNVALPTTLKKGVGLMPYLAKSLPTPEKQQMLRHFFSRQSRNQLYPGSIITVTVDHAPMTFTGVLLAIRRRGPDTSFVVRNIIQRTGVEMQFFVNSPHLKEIKLLQKPPKGRMRRAKLYYLRDAPEKMSMLAGNKKY